MKNQSFANVLGVLMAMLAALAGFLLMPGADDVKRRIGHEAASEFMHKFNGAEEVKNGAMLPLVELLSAEGRKVDLSSLTKGRVTIVNFWASWCAPCLEELPSLARLQHANSDVLIVPISLDMQKTPAELARFFKTDELRELRWFYDESGELRKALNLAGYPSTYVLDKNGRIIYILQGAADWASPEALKFVKSLISN